MFKRDINCGFTTHFGSEYIFRGGYNEAPALSKMDYQQLLQNQEKHTSGSFKNYHWCDLVDV
jgi:hypothetical protein